VAFSSSATNLVAGDTIGVEDIFGKIVGVRIPPFRTDHSFHSRCRGRGASGARSSPRRGSGFWLESPFRTNQQSSWRISVFNWFC
jgi:hypothetical protein